MHCTYDTSSIATRENYCSSDVANRIWERNRRRIEDALADGSDYWRLAQKMPRLTFKTWLESIGKTYAEAKKYARFFSTFRDFPIEKIERISLTTLFSLCQKRYQQMVCKMRSLPACTEAQVQDLLKEERERQKATRCSLVPKTGLISVPGGGRAYQFPLLQDEEAMLQRSRFANAKLLQIQEKRNLTPLQLLKEATQALFEKTLLLSERLAGYNPYARGYKQGAENMESLQQYIAHEAASTLNGITWVRPTGVVCHCSSTIHNQHK